MRWTVVVFLVLATMLLFSRADSAYTAFQANAVPLQDFAALTLGITSAQSTYLVGEPLSLEIQLANETAGPIIGHNRIDPAFGLFRLMVSSDGQEAAEYWGPGWGLKDTPISPTEILPGETISRSTTILFNHTGVVSDGIPTTLAFPFPGHYILKAELNDLGPLKIESQTLAIDVVEPQGVDVDAWKLIRSKEAIYFLHTGSPKQDPRIVENFEHLVSSYPKSRYARYIGADVTPVAPALQTISPEETEVTDVISSFAVALNARDYVAVVNSTSLEFEIRERWERGGEDQEEIRQGLQEIVDNLGEFSIEIDHLQISGFEATADITVISGNQGTFNSYIILFKDWDGAWRIFESGF